LSSEIRTAKCTLKDASKRLKSARAYLEVAELILEDDREEFASVAAGNAVLAGIAAADALCCKGLGERARDRDHRKAAELVKNSSARGARHKSLLLRLLDLKDEAHYGFLDVSPGSAQRAVNSARELVDGAIELIQR
jgi:hypothetical protein